MTAPHARIIITLLSIGLLSACGTQATNTPISASQPTEPVAASSPVSLTETPTAVHIEVPATQASSQGVTVSFTDDVLLIFNSRCANCHGGNRTEEGLVLLTYTGILRGSDNGPVVVAGNADGSLLVEQVVSQEMPKRGPKLTPPQIQLIVDWINQGALEN